MKEKIKNLLIIIFPLLLGSLVGFIISSNDYQLLNKPVFAPPSFIFPVVWSILYLLMGISSYLIFKSDNKNKWEALLIYVIQLFWNLAWSFIFFIKKDYILSFSWIIILIVLVIIMIIKFYKIDKKAAYLQIPYLLWLIFASILNLYIVFLN